MSPKMQLATDTVLMFQLNTQRGGSLDIYTTSDVEHISTRIAEFPASGAADSYDDAAYNMTDDYYVSEESSSSVTYAVQTVCVPRTSNNVAFISSALYSTDSVQPDVIVKDVELTGTPCPAETSPGNASTVILELCVNAMRRISKCDDIQNSSLTSDKELKLLNAFLCHHI